MVSHIEKIDRYRPLEDPAVLREWLTYDPETGEFFWRKSRRNIVAGEKAGTICRKRGYVSLQFAGVPCLAHRLAFVYQTGALPSGVVDHINGNPSDNRWCNLRDVPPSMNRQNLKKATALSATGVLGVYVARSKKGYYSIIGVDGRYIYSQTFRTIEAASAWYINKKRQLHPGCTI